MPWTQNLHSALPSQQRHDSLPGNLAPNVAEEQWRQKQDLATLVSREVMLRACCICNFGFGGEKSNTGGGGIIKCLSGQNRCTAGWCSGWNGVTSWNDQKLFHCFCILFSGAWRDTSHDQSEPLEVSSHWTRILHATGQSKARLSDFTGNSLTWIILALLTVLSSAVLMHLCSALPAACGQAAISFELRSPSVTSQSFLRIARRPAPLTLSAHWSCALLSQIKLKVRVWSFFFFSIFFFFLGAYSPFLKVSPVSLPSAHRDSVSCLWARGQASPSTALQLAPRAREVSGGSSAPQTENDPMCVDKLTAHKTEQDKDSRTIRID